MERSRGWGRRGMERKDELGWHKPFSNGLNCTTESQMWSNKYRRAQLTSLWGLYVGRGRVPFVGCRIQGNMQETPLWNFKQQQVRYSKGDSIKNILQWANCTKEIVFIRKVILSIESGDMRPFTPLWCKNKQGYGIHFTILIGPACTISKPSVIPKFWLNIYVTSDAFTIDYYIEFWRYFAIKMMKGLMAYSY